MFLIPLTWPFLVIYLFFRFWRVTLPLTGLIGLSLLVQHAPMVGVPVTAAIALVVFWVLRIRAQDDAVARENDRRVI